MAFDRTYEGKHYPEPAKGLTLLANPFLKDPHFSRSAVLLCTCSPEGAFGFVINKTAGRTLNEVMPDTFKKEIKLYIGGPVQQDTVHFIHHHPDLLGDEMEVKPGIFWGGNFQVLITYLNENMLSADEVRFFLGYSGWGAGQLEDEMRIGSWIVTESSRDLLFDQHMTDKEIWARHLRRMGEDYARIANYPIDPTLN